MLWVNRAFRMPANGLGEGSRGLQGGPLLGDAMDRTQAPNQVRAIDGHHPAIGEKLLQGCPCRFVGF